MIATKPRFGLGRVVLDAEVEAARRGDRRIGTEHLLLALLLDPDSLSARALGVSLTTARERLQELDREALAAVGIALPLIDLDAPATGRRRPQITPGAAEVFKSLGKLSRRDRLGTQHVLLALVAREKPDPAAALIDALRVDRAQLRQRLSQV